MELEKHTKDELKNMFNVPRIDINEKAIQHIIEILNRDSLFDNILGSTSTNKNSAFRVLANTTTIAYNLESFKRNVERVYSRHPLYDLTLDDYYRFYFLYSYGHEGEHIIQSEHSIKGLYPYEDLNNAYKIAAVDHINGSVMDLIIYRMFHDHYFYERSASIEAAKLSMDIFDDDLFSFAALAHFNHLFVNGYTLKGKHVISPVEQTMKYLHEKRFTYSDVLPFDIAFENGFPITLEEYQYLCEPIYECMKKGEKGNYKDAINRIQVLTLERQETTNNR